MPIQKEYDVERQLTILKTVGQVNRSEILAAFDDFYSNKPTLNALWDHRESDLSCLSSDDVHEIVEFSVRASEKRAGGKTAVVCGNTVNYGMGRMIQNLAEVSPNKTLVEVFKRIDDAYEWLSNEDPAQRETEGRFSQKDVA